MQSIKSKLSVFLTVLLVVSQASPAFASIPSADLDDIAILSEDLDDIPILSEDSGDIPILQSGTYYTTDNVIRLVFDTSDVDPDYVDKMLLVASPSEATYRLYRQTASGQERVSINYTLAEENKASPSNASDSNASDSNASPHQIIMEINNTNHNLRSGNYILVVEVSDYDPVNYTFRITFRSSGGSSSGGGGGGGGSSSRTVSSDYNWHQDNIGWWVTHVSTGSYPVNQWVYISGYWYYFGSDGYMDTGWLELNGQRFFTYDSGNAATDWVFIGDHWFYFDDNAYMQTGWQYLGDNWFFFYDSGDMATNWVFIDNNWYFFYDSGNMAVSIQIGDYYVNQDGISTR